MADGSINFDTTCDDSGVKKLSSTVKESMSRMSEDIKKAFSGNGTQEATKSAAQLKKKFEAAGNAVDKQRAKIEQLQQELDAVKSQKGVFGEPEAAKPLIAEAEELKAKIDEAKAKSREYSEQWKQGVNGAESKQEEWNKKVLQLTEEYDKVLNKIEQIEKKANQPVGDNVKNQKIEELTSQISAGKTKLAGLEAKAETAKSKLSTALSPKNPNGFKTAMKSAGGSLEKFNKRVVGLAKRVFIFTVITKALRKLKELLSSSFSSDTQITNSLQNIKSNLYTAFQPVYEYVLPAIRELMAALARATQFLAVAMARVFHKNVAEMQKNAKALKNQSKATKDLGKEAEKAATSLAGFDEINALAGNSEDAADAMENGGPTFDTDYSPWANDEMQKRMDELLIIIAGAMVVIGVILLFTGANIPLGLGLIAVGAAILASEIAANWNTMDSEVKRVLTIIMAMLGGFLLVIGVILVLTGANIPLGIAMIIAGAVAIVTAVALNWKETEDKVGTILNILTGVVGGAFLALGIILTLSGNLPLGIAFLVAGAVLIMSAITLNTDLLPEKVQNVILVIASIVGPALLALGAIFVALGQLPIGLACLAAGVVTIVTALRIQDKLVSDKASAMVQSIMAIVGGALAALGIILLLAGQMPLGIALLLAGAAAFVTAVATTPGDTLKEKIKNLLNGIIDLVERTVNYIVDKLNSISFTVPDWVPKIGGGRFGFNIPRASIPRLATGTVVPANSGEFLSILGDNKTETEVVSPLSTMKQAFKEALAESGNGASGDMSITVYLSVADVTKAVVNRVNGTTKQTGTCPIKLKV